MTDSWKVFRAGTRSSPLALRQTAHVIKQISKLLPLVDFETVRMDTPGDQDRETDLRSSPPDFFSRTLDAALLEERIDLAVHSAKDLPEPLPEGLDWFWLPAAGDRRDALVGSLAPRLIGVSSQRRAEYAVRRFPHAELKPLRGNIGERLQQLDEGRFDLLIMAGVALQRLGLEQRIAEWIPLEELDTPEGQGALAVTFRRGDPRMQAIRKLFIKTPVFAGAGVSEGQLTLDAMRALRNAEVCLYDALMDDAVLHHLSAGAKRIYVGKRQGEHSRPQEEINRMLCDYVRKGYRTVRLKGGDPGIFGRLAEEIEALEVLGLPGRVIPGISAMQTAAAGSGVLLTRRGVSRGFTVMTPRLQGGATGAVDAAARAELPIVFYMAVTKAGQVAAELMEDGLSGNTPCVLVFAAGADNEAVYRCPLDALEATLGTIPDRQRKLPGLLIVGEIARYGFDAALGALGGRRVLLTCSEALMERCVQSVYDLGGRPVQRPLIRLQILPQAADIVRHMADFDWIALTSPSAVRCLHEVILCERLDMRSMPRIMTTGPGSVRALEKAGLGCELVPEADFSSAGLLAAATGQVKGQKVLRLRSARAGADLAEGLRTAGADVTDCVLYENCDITYSEQPEFDAVFFASASAVASFVRQWQTDILTGKMILAMGGPTADELQVHGVKAHVAIGAGTVEENLLALAAACL